MNPAPLIVTAPSGYDRRVTKDLLTLALIPPSAFLQPDFPCEVNVVDRHNCARNVRINGCPRTFKRRPEIRIPWVYGYARGGEYGHFVSTDGTNWDSDSLVPYRVLSVLPAADQRRARKEAK